MEDDSALQWLVACTKPQQERWAAENVKRQGYAYWLPMTLAKASGRKPPEPVCLFPRYLFVGTTGPWRSLLGTFGIHSLVMWGDKPARLPRVTFDEMRDREGPDGLIYLPNSPGSRFKRGETLRINEGPLIGYTGICAEDSGPRRVRILLDFLGRASTVSVDNDWVKNAQED